MQIDAQKMADALPYMHLLWQGPVQLAVATYMLYHFMGPAGLAGLGVMIVSMPLNTWLGKQTAKFTKVTMAARDRRVKFTNELLQGMKIIKYFAWEPAMSRQLAEKRDAELRASHQHADERRPLLRLHRAPLVVTAVTFVIYGALEGTPTPPRRTRRSRSSRCSASPSSSCR